MIIDDQEFIMKILDCVVSVPTVPIIDAFEFIWVLSIASSAFFFSGQLFLGTPLLLGTTGAVVAAFTSFLPKPFPNPL